MKFKNDIKGVTLRASVEESYIYRSYHEQQCETIKTAYGSGNEGD